jgi:hemerythrin
MSPASEDGRMKWTDQQVFGMPSIDAEHLALLETMNDLRHVLMQGDSRNLAGPLLRSLLTYTRGYCAREIEQAAPPTEQIAVALHIECLMDRCENGEVALDLQLLHVFDDWLANPIQKADRSSRPWLPENSVH